MQNYNDNHHRIECDNCGKEGAVMGNSVWEHSFICCDNNCCFELKKKIEVNTRNSKFKRAMSDIESAKQRARDIKYKGLRVDSNPFEYTNGEI